MVFYVAIHINVLMYVYFSNTQLIIENMLSRCLVIVIPIICIRDSSYLSKVQRKLSHSPCFCFSSSYNNLLGNNG